MRTPGNRAVPNGKPMFGRLLAGVPPGLLALGFFTEITCAQSTPALLHHTHDSGGGRSASASYTLDSSLGGFGGVAGTGSFSARMGFAGQLDEPPNARPDLVERLRGRSVKILVSDLLLNDDDAEHSALTLTQVAAISRNGFSIARDGPWLIYQSIAPLSGDDFFHYWIADDFGNVERGDVRVATVSADGTPTLNILQIGTEPGGTNRLLLFAGIPGRIYEIQAATNLSEPGWVAIGSGVAAANGLYSFIDTNAHLFNSRFYRALQP